MAPTLPLTMPLAMPPTTVPAVVSATNVTAASTTAITAPDTVTAAAYPAPPRGRKRTRRKNAPPVDAPPVEAPPTGVTNPLDGCVNTTEAEVTVTKTVKRRKSRAKPKKEEPAPIPTSAECATNAVKEETQPNAVTLEEHPDVKTEVKPEIKTEVQTEVKPEVRPKPKRQRKPRAPKLPEEPPEELPKELPREPAEDTPKQPPQEPTKQPPKELPKKSPKETSIEPSKDTPKDLPKETPTLLIGPPKRTRKKSVKTESVKGTESVKSVKSVKSAKSVKWNEPVQYTWLIEQTQPVEATETAETTEMHYMHHMPYMPYMPYIHHTAPAPNLDKIRSDLREFVTQMMYVSGETGEPSLETLAIIEEIVRQQVIELLRSCTELAARRGSRSITINDLIFQIRHDAPKVSRLRTFLSWKDVRKNVKDSDDKGADDIGGGEDVAGAPLAGAPVEDGAKKNKKNKQVLPWEPVSFFSQEVPERDEEEDEEEEEMNYITLQRLRKADERTKAMTKEEYVTWSEYRQASFTYRKSKRFREWAGFGIVTDSKPSDDIVDILGFLTFEMVQTLTEEALRIKDHEDQWKERTGDEARGTKKRKLTQGLFNLPGEGRTPVEPKHIQEAFRRLQTRQKKYRAMLNGTRLSSRPSLKLF
ncbi:Transcription initiation protein spt3 [Sporothrix stenoceras]